MGFLPKLEFLDDVRRMNKRQVAIADIFYCRKLLIFIEFIY